MMWQFPIGAVVRWIPTEEDPEPIWGHVWGFSTSAQGLTGVWVRWQHGGFCMATPSEIEVAA